MSKLTRKRRINNTVNPGSAKNSEPRGKSKRHASAPEVSLSDFRNLVYHHLESINSPRSLAIYLIMRNTDLNPEKAFDDEILSLRTDPMWFNSSSAFQGFYDPTELVRKWTGLIISWDPELIAREKFAEAELQCSSTNRRMLNDSICGSDLNSIRGQLRNILSSVLGPVDSSLLHSCVREGGWGKGSTSSCKGMWVTEYHKLEAKPQATRTFIDLARSIMSDVSSLWDNSNIEPVIGSKVEFVPKDAKTHRCIAVEPSMNMFLQKGIGKAIRRRLHRRWNLNLHSQQRNQDLAEEGSKFGSYATIDLSSASDTVAYQVIVDLLPPDWVALLRSCRSAFTELDGKPLFLNKWSSMGNGYTFELETLLFASIVRVSIDSDDWYAGRWSVYGDDIIVPTYAYSRVCNLLAYFGFTLNDRKTFATGPFRESCGADWFAGEPVRPFYLKEVNWLTLVNYANWLRLNKRPWRIKRTWIAIRLLLGLDFPIGPAGDHGLALLFVDEAEIPESRRYPVLHKGRFGFLIQGFRFRPRKFSSNQIDGDHAVLAHLRLLSARSPTNLFEGSSMNKIIDVPLSEPWFLTAREAGKWVQSRSLFIRKDGRWPVLSYL